MSAGKREKTMELSEIFSVWDRFERSSAVELALEKEGFSFRLKKAEPSSTCREENASAAVKNAPAAGAVLALPKSDGQAPVRADAAEETARPDALSPGEGLLLSPLAGTFYRAPSPDADAYASIGQLVRKGDVVGVVEAMKLFNEVKADREGELKEFLVQDGEFVEFHQPLMRIE